MTRSTLGRLLSIIEKSQGALSVQALARELDVTPERVEDMMQYWIRRGKIRSANNLGECTGCSAGGDCQFILEMPRTYEMVMEGDGESSVLMEPACK